MNKAAQELGRLGGKASAASMTAQQRQAKASNASKVRWEKKQKFKGEPVIYIYGIFNGAICEYVGSTVCPRERKRSHRGMMFGILKWNPSWTFKVLETHYQSKVGDSERRLITSYRAQGQCRLNILPGVNRSFTSKRTNPDYTIKTTCGQTFYSMASFCRWVGLSVGTFRNAKFKSRGELRGVKFTIKRGDAQ